MAPDTRGGRGHALHCRMQRRRRRDAGPALLLAQRWKHRGGGELHGTCLHVVSKQPIASISPVLRIWVPSPTCLLVIRDTLPGLPHLTSTTPPLSSPPGLHLRLPPQAHRGVARLRLGGWASDGLGCRAGQTHRHARPADRHLLGGRCLPVLRILRHCRRAQGRAHHHHFLVRRRLQHRLR